MGRRPTVELILAGVMVALIIAFVVLYGWLMRQIDTVGVGEMPGAGGAAATASTGSDTGVSAAAPTSTPGAVPTPPAGGGAGARAGASGGGGEEDFGKIGGLGGAKRMRDAGF